MGGGFRKLSTADKFISLVEDDWEGQVCPAAGVAYWTDTNHRSPIFGDAIEFLSRPCLTARYISEPQKTCVAIPANGKRTTRRVTAWYSRAPAAAKTKTLTIKLARILAEDVQEPRGVACITYNNECARELETRLYALGVEPGRRVFIGTVHSFSLTQIVMPYAKCAGLSLPEEFQGRDTAWNNGSRWEGPFAAPLADRKIQTTGISVWAGIVVPF